MSRRLQQVEEEEVTAQLTAAGGHDDRPPRVFLTTKGLSVFLTTKGLSNTSISYGSRRNNYPLDKVVFYTTGTLLWCPSSYH